MWWRWARELAIGSVAGYAATHIMDKGSAFLYERQDEASREREEELRQEMPTTVLVRRIADWRHLKLDEERAGQLGMWLHYGFGTAGGPATTVLKRVTGMAALPAGLAVGTAMWMFVDEGANYVLGLTPPAPEWPAVTHLRSLANHLLYGAALGSMLALIDRLLPPRR